MILLWIITRLHSIIIEAFKTNIYNYPLIYLILSFNTLTRHFKLTFPSDLLSYY